MNCSKCGHKNPDNAKICESCSFDLANSQGKKPKARRNIFIALSFLFAGLSPLFLIFINPRSAFLAALLSFCLTIYFIPQNIRDWKTKKIKKRAIVISTIIIIISSFQMLIFSFWSIDVPPIPNDYTINDIKSAAPEYNKSYELLLSLADNNDGSTENNVIGLSQEDVNNLENIYHIFSENNLQEATIKLKEKEKDILALWDKAEKGREIFAKLDSFPEIADLSEPNLNTEYPMLKNFRFLVFLYRTHICLQSISGNNKQALEELTMLDSIIKKITVHSRTAIMKLVCIASSAININTIDFLINNPETTNETLLVIKNLIDSFSDTQTSLRNILIFDYLSLKNEMEKMAKVPKVKYSSFSPLKLNSSLRLFRNYYDGWIAYQENHDKNRQLRIWPALFPDIPVKINNDGKLHSLYYKIYNPVGYLLVEDIAPSVEKAILLQKRFEVHSDMLKVVINARLGEKVNLKALYSVDEYIIDTENKCISYKFSARKIKPSHEFSASVSEDVEIKLPINPEVLDFTK